MSTLRVTLAQDSFPVGDLEGNALRVRTLMDDAAAAGSDVLLLPELALTGYPPEDLLLASGFVERQLALLDELVAASKDVTVVLGFVDVVEPRHVGDSLPRRLANAAAVFRDGSLLGVVHKRLLPNYGVFDEERYFAPGSGDRTVFHVAGVRVGVLVCEDLWRPDGADELAALGAELLLVPNASPYHRGKPAARSSLVTGTALRTGVAVAYVNSVGGQDEVVFDGGSLVAGPDGALVGRAPVFTPSTLTLDVPLGASSGVPAPRPALVAPWPSCEEEEVYEALVLALREYVNRNGFPGVVLGLSGGVDSALVATLAVDALGADRVIGVGMPGPYSSEGSVTDACDLAARLGVRFEVLPIGDVFAAYTSTLSGVFAGLSPDVTEENLQARARGAMLMALSNKLGHLVLSTGNKSETAVGYSTLYGDMCGGFAVLSDVEKTLVYRLCHWRNRAGWRGRSHDAIPAATLEKPPSAELAPDQQDSDSLPPYEVLDPLLERYVEWALSPTEILTSMAHVPGVDAALVARVVSLVDRNEYKRRQAPPGVKVTRRSFGRDRRLPITSAWRPARTLLDGSAPVPTRSAVCAALSGAYDEAGIEAWWARPRSALSGRTPAEAFASDPVRVLALAAELSGPATSHVPLEAS